MSISIEHILIFLVVPIAIFLLMREIMMWYWKINKMITLLEDIRDALSSKKEDSDTEKSQTQ